ADNGQAIATDPRRLVWQVHDHPIDADLALARLAFTDGTPAPAPLLHFPGPPSLYLHGATLLTGLPPPAPDPSASVPVPRAALVLPEAGRFAARSGIVLPGVSTGRFRREALRARFRARLDLRRPDGAVSDEVVVVELAALAPDGTPRALYDAGTW